MTQVALRGIAKPLSNKMLFRMKKVILQLTKAWLIFIKTINLNTYQRIKMHLLEFDRAFKSETFYVSKERNHSETTKTAIQV